MLKLKFELQTIVLLMVGVGAFIGFFSWLGWVKG
jgi:hypothetical protein